MSAKTGRTVVFACARANLGEAQRQGALPSGVELYELPCTGRISLPLLIEGLAQGADGILVLGRHQRTCRFDGAEDSARERCERGALLLGLSGVARERLRFMEPDPGPEGPLRAVESFVDAIAPLGRNPLARRQTPEPLADHESLDAALRRLSWIAGDGELPPAADSALGTWLDAEGLPAPTPSSAVLLAGALPQLALAGGELFRPLAPASVLGAALAVLARLGVVAGVARSTFPGRSCFAMAGNASEAPADAPADVTTFEQLLAERAGELPRPPAQAKVACADAAAAELVRGLGYAALEVEAHALPDRFALRPGERHAATRYLEGLAAKGAAALYVGDVQQLFRWASVARHGAWQSHFVSPVGAAMLAQLSLAKLPLTPTFIGAPLVTSATGAPVARAGEAVA
jgi:F420-non-reducing hydrogenase iron-sulfur subunit